MDMNTPETKTTRILDVIVGRVRHTSEGFSVYSARTQGPASLPVVVKQFVGPVREGQRWTICGKPSKDPKWGDQFEAAFATLSRPTTLRELEMFCTSGLVGGWGWREFDGVQQLAGPGADVEQTPSAVVQLAVQEKLSAAQVKSFLDAWNRGADLAQVYSDLAEWGVTGRTADALVRHYGDKTIASLREDPYKHLLDIPGYGWKSAELIASWLGILPADERRITAGIEYAVHNATWIEGHTWLSPRDATNAARSLLGQSYEAVSPLIEHAVEGGHLVAHGPQLYPAPLDRAEESIVGSLFARRSRPGLVNLQRTQGMFEGTPLNALQLEAVLKGLTEPISLLTGGPGTGKTTALRTLVTCALQLGLGVTCMAPTGKAAARMSEATGHPASTVHSKLHLVPGDTGEDALEEPLAGLVIVDEVSMLDTQLAAAMLGRISLGAQLLLVGDPDQLPSVGPGAILRDLITTELLPRTHLEHVYRNDAAIALNAARIRAGKAMDSVKDCVLAKVATPGIAADWVVRKLAELLAEGYALEDILVLTPTNDGPVGRLALNAVLQPLLNDEPAGSGITQYVGTSADPDGTLRKRSEELRVGDRVMVTRNNRELGCFNGQVGRVVGLTAPRSLDVEIDGETITFAGEDKRSLTLAYAITGHKSQGSEAPIVISPIFPSRVLCREWLYTVLTRAKEKAYFVGDLGAMNSAIGLRRAFERRTGLVGRIKEGCEYGEACGE